MLIVIPNKLDDIELLADKVDGFILGIDKMSVNNNITLKSLSYLDKIKDKQIFISLNKNFENRELEKLKSILIELNKYNIKGVLFYDLAVLNISKSLDLNYDLVLSQEHLSTSYTTINYYNDLGVKYAYLSSDITLEEINEILKKSKTKLMVNLFGYLPMFVSKRHAVKNYLEYFNLKDSSKINYIEKEGKIYPIVDNDIAVQVYSNNILNGIKSYVNLDIDYVVLNGFNIEIDKFIQVVDMFKSVNKSNADENYSKINSMFKNVDEGFLNTKTIYKVKHEK